MGDCVVDTDVFSFMLKLDTRAGLYHPYLAGKAPILSFMTVAELESWAIARNWGTTRKSAFEHYLQGYFIYHSERALCHKWAEVIATSKRKGRPITDADAWIAATALLVDVPLVTHNKDHYVDIDGLTIISQA